LPAEQSVPASHADQAPPAKHMPGKKMPDQKLPTLKMPASKSSYE
jgi:hypothetical protein